jgi:hypothetical protein
MTTLTAPSTTAPVRTPAHDGRMLPAAGGAFAVLAVVGNGIYTEGGLPLVGYGLELLGYGALALFAAWVATSLRATREWAALLAGVGAMGMIAVKLGGWAAVWASHQAGTGTETAAALVAIDESAWVVGWLPYGLFVIGLSLAALGDGRLPRPVAWVGLGTGIACLAAVPFSTSEPFVLPWLISLVWLVTASTLLARGQRRNERPWSVEV